MLTFNLLFNIPIYYVFKELLCCNNCNILKRRQQNQRALFGAISILNLKTVMTYFYKIKFEIFYNKKKMCNFNLLLDRIWLSCYLSQYFHFQNSFELFFSTQTTWGDSKSIPIK